MEEVRIVLSWGALVKVALDTTLLEFIFPFHIEAVSETKEQVAIRARFRKDARRRQQVRRNRAAVLTWFFFFWFFSDTAAAPSSGLDFVGDSDQDDVLLLQVPG